MQACALILQPSSISPSFFFFIFASSHNPESSWRQIHEHSEKIYCLILWGYQYFSYNKISFIGPNWESNPIKMCIVTSGHFPPKNSLSCALLCVKCFIKCTDAGTMQVPNCTYAHPATHIQVRIHTQNIDTRIHGRFHPSSWIYPSVCQSILNGMFQVGSLKNTHYA